MIAAVRRLPFDWWIVSRASERADVPGTPSATEYHPGVRASVPDLQEAGISKYL
jgi:hypothetical protein